MLLTAVETESETKLQGRTSNNQIFNMKHLSTHFARVI